MDILYVGYSRGIVINDIVPLPTQHSRYGQAVLVKHRITRRAQYFYATALSKKDQFPLPILKLFPLGLLHFGDQVFPSTNEMISGIWLY